MKNLIVKGFVEVVLKDKNGNVIAREEGENTVVEMSNNILMDLIYPRLGAAGAGVNAADRPEAANMTDNTNFPTGANYIGPTGVANQATHTQNLSNLNQIAYISVGDNLGTDSAGNAHNAANQDVATPDEQVDMVDDAHDHTSVAPGVVYTRYIDSVTFPSAKSIKFTTTFDTDQGNVANGISEIGLWTAGDNIDDDGFVSVETPTTTTNMRMFARKVLGNTITKTDDGTLDINYTLTFGA
jgi:hypothetical protein